MKCESCQQAEATILFTTVSGDEKKEVHLCPQCAKTESERQQEIQAGGEPKVKPAQVKKVQVVVGQLECRDISRMRPT